MDKNSKKVIDLIQKYDNLSDIDKIRLAIYLLVNKNFSVDFNVRDMIILLKQVLSILDPNYTKVITNFSKYKHLLFFSAKYLELTEKEKKHFSIEMIFNIYENDFKDKIINNEINNNQVFIDDIDLNYYKFSALKDNIIYISQNEILFSDSIINNLCLGEEKDVSEIVKLCEIDDILHKRQLNFNYIIEENGFNLSGGERQRLILGRALLKKFKILLIDEGLNQMDVNLERRILKRLFKKYSDRTIIVVSHRLDNCDLYNHHIELNKGRLVKDICKNE